MMKLNSIKLLPRVLGAFVIVAAIAAFVGVVGITNMRKIDNADTVLYEHMTVPLSQLAVMGTSLHRIRVNILEAISESGTQEAKGFAERALMWRTELEKKSDEFDKAIIGKKTKSVFDEYSTLNKEYDPAITRILNLAVAGKAKEAEAFMRTQTSLVRKVQGKMDKLVEMTIADAKASSKANAALANKATTTVIALVCVAVLMALSLGLVITLSVSKPISDVKNTANRLALGDTDVLMKASGRDEISDLARSMIKVSESIRGLIDETGVLSGAAIEGCLDIRGDADKFEGGFRDIILGVNNTLDAVIGPLNVAAEYVERISNGDIPQKITDEYNGDFNEIKNNLNRCIDSVNALVVDAGILSAAAIVGKLDTRADETKHQGDFHKIIKGVNETLDTLVGHMNSVPAPLMIIDNDFNIQYMNQTGADILGKSKAQIVGSKCYDNFKTSDCKTAKCACARAMSDGRKAASETDAHPNGMNLDISYVGVPIKDQQGAVIGVLEVVTDQTAIKQAGRLQQKISEFQDNEVKSLVENLGKFAEGNLNFTLDVSEGDNDTVETRANFVSISDALNQSVKAIKCLVDDANMLSIASVEGKLDTRADAVKHQGEFRKIIEGVNNTLDAVIGPLNVAAEYVERISNGDIPQKITDEYNGDFNEIKNNLNRCIDSVNSLVVDAEMLSASAIVGKLDTRADETKHQGDFHKIVQGVNETLDTLVGHMNSVPSPLMIIDNDFNIQYMNQTGADILGKSKAQIVGSKCYDNFKTSDCKTAKCACARAMSDGRKAASETDAHPNGMNLDISYVGVPIKDQQGAVIGVLEVVTDQTAIKQAGRLQQKISEFQDNEVKSLVENLGKFAEGNLNFTLDVSIGDKDTAEVRASFVAISEALNQSVNAIKQLVEDANMLSNAAVDGKLGTRADISKHGGDFRKIVQGVNETLDSVIGPLNVAAEYVDRISNGDIPEKIVDKYNGDFNEIKNNLNKCIDALRGIIEEDGGKVLQAAANKDLTVRVTRDYQGAYQLMKNNINQLLENLESAIQKVAEGANKVADSTSTLSKTAADVGKASQQIAETVDQVATGSQEQSTTVQNSAEAMEQLMRAISEVAMGAQSQAKQVDQTVGLVQQITAAIDEVAKNSGNIAKASREVNEVAIQGGVQVTKSTEGMAQIKKSAEAVGLIVDKLGDSSQKIGAIVETIDDIAEQTNLLALNAAIEAARAGEHGKGFAVVADEVRKLAERSSKATGEIADLIGSMQQMITAAVSGMQDSAKQVAEGTMLSAEAGDALKNIQNAVKGIVSQIDDMASAAQQMSASSTEVIKAIENVSAVTEETTAATEEMAASSSEVSRQIEQVAAVSEENAAAAEEVSATTQEQTAAAEEMTAGTEDLASMAEDLQELVSAFKLSDNLHDVASKVTASKHRKAA